MKRVLFFGSALSSAVRWSCTRIGTEISKQYENAALNAPSINLPRKQFTISLDST